MNTSASRLPHIAARALLALVFLCMQQTATLHWLSHAVEATRPVPADSDKGVPAAHHCDACLAFSALGAAATGGPVAVASMPAPHFAASTAHADASPAATRLAFRSRAPPVLT